MFVTRRYEGPGTTEVAIGGLQHCLEAADEDARGREEKILWAGCRDMTVGIVITNPLPLIRYTVVRREG